MEFKQFRELLQAHIAEMTKDQTHLFAVGLGPLAVWDTYLNSFPPGTNEVFRERREHDCNCCRQFIRDLGRVVAIKDQKIITIWDFETGSPKYQPVVDALAKLVKSAKVINVLTPVQSTYGTETSFEALSAEGGFITWNHLSATLPPNILNCTPAEQGTERGLLRDARHVFERGLSEINPTAIETVLELIDQDSLYRGEGWQGILESFAEHQTKYLAIPNEDTRALYTWEHSVSTPGGVTGLRNSSVGVLLRDLTDGMELDQAVGKYEAMVAPTNYRRPKAIFSRRMVENAQKTIADLGLEPSLPRRFARMDDITVNNTLFANRDSRKVMGGVFDEMIQEIPTPPRNLSRVEEIPIGNFIRDVLPKASSVEAYLENKHQQNMCSLIAPANKDSEPLFAWENGFSWAYEGNITDSMKERVKAAGGKVDGVLRFSIQWNDKDDCLDDLDAHCIEPSGNRIFFQNMKSPYSKGELDVDIVNPSGVAVENITWPSRQDMPPGFYEFYVHNYTSRNGRSGFTAEIEFDGQIHSFEYPKPLTQNEGIPVATVHFDGENFKIKSFLPSNTKSKEVWGLNTNNFYPVSIALLSPNYWDFRGVGLKHYFFMLQGCRNPGTPNGFFNEFLKADFREHKRVFEALGSKMKVQPTEDQLSGLGFSASKRADLTVKVNGAFERLLKIKF